jgi:hypothetical protein
MTPSQLAGRLVETRVFSDLARQVGPVAARRALVLARKVGDLPTALQEIAQAVLDDAGEALAIPRGG